MDSLIDAVLALVALVSPNKIRAVADRVRGKVPHEATGVSGLVATASARAALNAIVVAWRESQVSGDLLAGLLLGAESARRRALAESSTELVWTGPTTPFVPTRRTEQVLLALIEGAQRDLFLTSFVAYDILPVVNALNEADRRGVEIRVLLESSVAHGGSLAVDPIATLRAQVPNAEIYAWLDRPVDFADGKVHAKVVVADGENAFVTSANLTGHALDKNMEAGVLIRGGTVPRALRSHLRALIETNVIRRV